MEGQLRQSSVQRPREERISERREWSTMLNSAGLVKEEEDSKKADGLTIERSSVTLEGAVSF